MRGRSELTLVLFGLFMGAALLPAPASAQQTRTLTVGLSVGGGAVHRRPGPDPWTFGPVFGGRVGWGNRRSALSMSVDLQPFLSEGSTIAGDFRALYLLPSYGAGSAGRRVRIGLGLALFQFEDGVTEEGIDVGLAAGASGSLRLPASFSLELGWRLTGDVRGLSANVLMLQLVRLWQF